MSSFIGVDCVGGVERTSEGFKGPKTQQRPLKRNNGVQYSWCGNHNGNNGVVYSGLTLYCKMVLLQCDNPQKPPNY